MYTDLARRVSGRRASYVARETELKEERRLAKHKRDYEIFTEMPYKLSSRKFRLDERHPISKNRFEAA